uniref:Apple domain-containing protein n=1 Tax=Parastrongyloides trichosuri TaxID=131310 RepID=A0A0N4Z6U2_PARTI
MKYIFYTSIFIISFYTSLCCVYSPILYGVAPLQPLGYSTKKVFTSSEDCRNECMTNQNFNCTAYLWPGYTGDCYILDTVDLSIQIFKDDGEYILYVKNCNETIPSVGYCEFAINQTNVAYSTATSFETPGLTTEKSCFQFCINQYNGFNYEAFIVKPNGVSTCNLYQDIPEGLSTGDANLWIKNFNCEYTNWSEWSTCTATCDGIQTKTRDFAKEGDPDGVPCLESEKTLTQNCSVPCDSVCTYDNWGPWGPCSSTCEQEQKRTLLTGTVELCDTDDEPLTMLQECTGDDCPTTMAPTTTAAPTTTVAPTTVVSTTKVISTTTLPATTTTLLTTTTTLSTTTTMAPCVFGNWTDWGLCGTDCSQERTRELLSGLDDYCLTINDTTIETQECTGDLCKIGITDPPPEPEPGCRIDNIDSNSKPSANFKAVGRQQSCNTKCKAETRFKCEAYITAGEGTSCILFGTITKPVMQVTHSVYYLQDINCTAGKTPETSICLWEKSGTTVNPNTGVGKGTKTYYYTMDEVHCENLCNMNHPMFKPNACGAWIYDQAPGFMKQEPNCFLFPPLSDADKNSFAGGNGTLFVKTCP